MSHDPAQMPAVTLSLSDRGRAFLDILYANIQGADGQKADFLNGLGLGPDSMKRIAGFAGVAASEEALLLHMKGLSHQGLFLLLQNARVPVAGAENLESGVDLSRVFHEILAETTTDTNNVEVFARGIWHLLPEENSVPKHVMGFTGLNGLVWGATQDALYLQTLVDSTLDKGVLSEVQKDHVQNVMKGRFLAAFKAQIVSCPQDERLAVIVSGIGAGYFACPKGYSKPEQALQKQAMKEEMHLALQTALRALSPDEQAKIAGVLYDTHMAEKPFSLPSEELPIPYSAIGSKGDVPPIPESAEAIMCAIWKSRGSSAEEIEEKLKTVGKLREKKMYGADMYAKPGSEGRRGIPRSDEAICATSSNLAERTGNGDGTPEGDLNAPLVTSSQNVTVLLGEESAEAARVEAEKHLEVLEPLLRTVEEEQRKAREFMEQSRLKGLDRERKFKEQLATQKEAKEIEGKEVAARATQKATEKQEKMKIWIPAALVPVAVGVILGSVLGGAGAITAVMVPTAFAIMGAVGFAAVTGGIAGIVIAAIALAIAIPLLLDKQGKDRAAAHTQRAAEIKAVTDGGKADASEQKSLDGSDDNNFSGTVGALVVVSRDQVNSEMFSAMRLHAADVKAKDTKKDESENGNSASTGVNHMDL